MAARPLWAGFGTGGSPDASADPTPAGPAGQPCALGAAWRGRIGGVLTSADVDETEAHLPREPGPEVERYWPEPIRATAIEWAGRARLADITGLAVDDATLERVADGHLRRTPAVAAADRGGPPRHAAALPLGGGRRVSARPPGPRGGRRRRPPWRAPAVRRPGRGRSGAAPALAGADRRRPRGRRAPPAAHARCRRARPRAGPSTHGYGSTGRDRPLVAALGVGARAALPRLTCEILDAVFREQMVRVAPGITLFVASAGAPGRPVLLVVHGGPDWDHSYLREPLSQLAGRHRVVLPDMRGCGRSTQGLGDARYTPDAVVTDLLGLADALGERRFSVLGFSWGGFIAQRLAVAAPERVDRLVIASSAVLRSDAAAFDRWPEREQRLAAEAAVWRDASLSGPELTRAAAFAGASADVWQARAMPGYLERLAAVRFSAEWLRPWRAGTLPPAELDDPIVRLAKTGVPVLLIHGRHDMRFAASAAQRAAAFLPRARAVVLDGAGHMAHVDQPLAWLQAIAGFLE